VFYYFEFLTFKNPWEPIALELGIIDAAGNTFSNAYVRYTSEEKDFAEQVMIRASEKSRAYMLQRVQSLRKRYFGNG
jgi:hypothetical protein